MNKTVLSTIIAFLIGAGGVIAYAQISGVSILENTFSREVKKEAGAVKLSREVVKGGYDLVTTVEFKKWMETGKEMIIVDTMPYEASYKKAHIPGAVQFLFPIPTMTDWDSSKTAGKETNDYIKLLGENKELPIVVYCGFVKCTRSHNGALWAKKLGYKNVYRLPGGIYAWKGAGFPTEQVK